MGSDMSVKSSKHSLTGQEPGDTTPVSGNFSWLEFEVTPAALRLALFLHLYFIVS